MKILLLFAVLVSPLFDASALTSQERALVEALRMERDKAAAQLIQAQSHNQDALAALVVAVDRLDENRQHLDQAGKEITTARERIAKLEPVAAAYMRLRFWIAGMAMVGTAAATWASSGFFGWHRFTIAGVAGLAAGGIAFFITSFL